MFSKIRFYASGLAIFCLGLFFFSFRVNQPLPSEDWGFFGHRKINRMAVFTLPPEMIGFYKQNLEYITEHAVDPDKRRYATRHEAVRHYIDIDHYGIYPFPDLPRQWPKAIAKYTHLYIVNSSGDTLKISGPDNNQFSNRMVTLHGIDPRLANGADSVKISEINFLYFIHKHILTQYYEDEWIIDCKDLDSLFRFSEPPLNLGNGNCQSAFAVDSLSHAGILPWHLEVMYFRLVKAFEKGDPKQILRLSADFGHYIGDSHVPLHATSNYNGQLTNQIGIHAFWESRIVELFSDEYDYFVGAAQYVEKPSQLFWETVLESNRLVDSVLIIEKRLSKTFPQDQQFCFDQRLETTVRTQCREYSKAYSDAMQGMVEDRFRKSIKTLGDIWYSAWVDAGQPSLKKLVDSGKETEEERKEREALEKKVQAGEVKGREHVN